MRLAPLAGFTFLVLIANACAGSTATEDDDAGASNSVPDASTGPKPNRADASSPTDASSSDAEKSDASPKDAGSDAAKDAGPAGDAGLDAKADAADANDGALPPNTNLARLGVASATSEYDGFYVAGRVNDGDPTTSWYSATNSCTSNPDGGSDYLCSGTPTSVQIALAAVSTVRRVVVLGNRDGYPTGYDVFTGRIELLNGSNAVVHSKDVTMTRGAEPNGDVDYVIAPAVAGVKTVRVVVLSGEASGPGLGEIEVYGP